MIATNHSIDWGTQIIDATEFLPLKKEHEVLIMHGAGEADQSRCKTLAEALASKTCRVITFDFIGHGRSTGTVSEMTLQNRAQQAEKIIHHFNLEKGLILVGFSMSGQAAIDVADKLKERVKIMALFVPAVYDKKARTAPFGPEFSKFIRRHESWRKSNAWDILASFKGNLVTFESPKDEVIPKPVLDKIHLVSKNTRISLRIEISDSTHSMALWISQKPERVEWFANTLLKVNESKSAPDRSLAKQSGVSFKILGKQTIQDSAGRGRRFVQD